MRLVAVRTATLLCLALAASGCGDDDTPAAGKPPGPGESFAAAHLDRFMLKPADLPPGYKRRDRATGTFADLVEAVETREERAGFDALAPGLKKFVSVGYRRKAGDNSNSPGSFALLYDTPAAAAKALPAVRRMMIDQYTVTGGFEEETPHSIKVSGLGDQTAPGVRLPLGPFAMYMYFWRVRNVVAHVAGGDTVGDMSRKTVLTMAKKIDYRAVR